MSTIEVFTCDCYPRGEIVQIVHDAIEKVGKHHTVKEYNIDQNPEEYSEALDRYGFPFGFEECINIFVDDKRVSEGKPKVEDLLPHLQRD